MILPSRDSTEAVSGAGLLRCCSVGVGQRVCKAVSKSSGGGDFRTSADTTPLERKELASGCLQGMATPSLFGNTHDTHKT